MMQIGRDEVIHVARLSRFALTETELSCMKRELSDILEYMQILDEMTGDVSAKTEGTPFFEATREDAVSPSAAREHMLANAPVQNGACIVVPKAVE